MSRYPVTCRYLSGDETILTPCRNLTDVQAKIASLHDRFAPEVTLFTLDFAEQCNIDQEPLSGPTTYSVIFHDVPKDSYFFSMAIFLHALAKDVPSITRALEMSSNLPALKEGDTNFSGQRLLHQAATHLLYGAETRVEPMQCLLDANMDLSTVDGSNRTVLHTCAYIGDTMLDVLGLLLETCRADAINVHVADIMGRKPLDEACSVGALQTVRCLIEDGANVNHADKRQWTPLFHLLYGSQKTFGELATSHTICTILLDNKANMHHSDKHGTTPFRLACVRGHKDIASLMIEYGANVNMRSSDGGVTCLRTAAAHYNADMVHFLVGQHKADLEVVDICGWTPLFQAVVGQESSTPEQVATVEALLEYGANVNHVGSQGWTPLAMAIMTNRTDVRVIEVLLRHGANVRAQTTNGWSPMGVAESRGHPLLTEVIYEAALEQDRREHNA
eukprot:GEMP01047377.1.p1 GENE.GEMP01047377.1~~GEMP01047377.1.p1  ORF type:complete len:447 (+),score=93.19 GEMP01047377.1:25-1365(+)